MNLSEELRQRLTLALMPSERQELFAEIEVERATYQATAYAWGRGDCGDHTAGDTLKGMDFGNAYGQAKREYLGEERYMLSNIRAAYEEWVSTGVIARTESDRRANLDALIEHAREEMAQAG